MESGDDHTQDIDVSICIDSRYLPYMDWQYKELPGYIENKKIIEQADWENGMFRVKYSKFFMRGKT